MDEAPTLTRRKVIARFANALAGKRPADRIGVATRELMLVWPAHRLDQAAERLLRDPALKLPTGELVLRHFEIAELAASAVFFRKKADPRQTLTQQGFQEGGSKQEITIENNS
jgi:hypothetical protein